MTTLTMSRRNPHVQAGLTWAGIAWAFRSSFAGNWFPLTWISHMLDCSLFGLDSGWHHFTNVCLHMLSTLLWFAVLKRLTGARWRSALVAFLFALHPLHVESVAWVAERKDVLSGLFWVLTLWGYAAYTARPGRCPLWVDHLSLLPRPDGQADARDLAGCALTAGPLALQRGNKILEKIPFFAASIGVSVVTFLVHKEVGATASLSLIPAVVRFENSLVSYVAYFLQMLWPADLAVFYPYPLGSLVVPAVIAGIALAAVTVLVIRDFPRRPYLAIGWLWYVITLLPVIGLIQVGAQARADRYTYIPMIGLAIALVWGVSEALGALAPYSNSAGCGAVPGVSRSHMAAGAVLAGQHLALSARHRGDSRRTMWRATIWRLFWRHGANSPRLSGQLRETVRIRPRFALAHAALGQLLAKQGQPEQALPELQTAVSLKPDLGDAHVRLGSVLGTLGRN